MAHGAKGRRGAALLLMLAGCASGGTGRGEVVEPAGMIAGMESRLLTGSVDVSYRAVATDAVTAELEGWLRISGDAISLRADGTFAGAPVSIGLDADADSMRLVSPGRSFTAPTPPHLREALVLGLTRMGILHNLARLASGAAPDHADEGIGDWLMFRDLRVMDPREESAGWTGIGYRLDVAGARAAEGVLWIDAASGLPSRREKAVTFPTGVMRVVEEYRWGGGSTAGPGEGGAGLRQRVQMMIAAQARPRSL